MRKAKDLALAVACVAMAVMGVATTAANPGDTAARSRADLTVFIPGEPPPGPFAPGDHFLSVNFAFDAHNGDELGSAVTRVVIAEVAGDDVTFILDCTVRLADGNLYFYGAGIDPLAAVHRRRGAASSFARRGHVP